MMRVDIPCDAARHEVIDRCTDRQAVADNAGCNVWRISLDRKNRCPFVIWKTVEAPEAYLVKSVRYFWKLVPQRAQVVARSR